MEPMTFIVANELAALPAVQAAAAVYCRAAGAGEEIARQTELVIEEIVTNIIQYEYLPGQRETLALTLSLADGVLEWLIRFQGIPFDVEALGRRSAEGSLGEIVANDGHGLGLQLLQRFSDEVRYRNLGWQGQEIRIRRAVAGAEAESRPGEEEVPAAPLPITIRRMRPDEAAAISKLAYFAYGYSYFKEELYDPEEVRRRNEDGRMQSYVIAAEATDEIVGHMAMIPDALTAMPELGVAFVNPRCRRNGSFGALMAAVLREAQAQGWQGVFGTAVTGHPYSQLAAIRMGLRETALLVSRVTPLDIRTIREKPVSRESFLYLTRFFAPAPRESYHAPLRHREMIAKIGENISLAVAFAESPEGTALPDRGLLEAKTDAYGAGHLVLRRWGGDTFSGVRAVLRRWCLDRLETIYLYLPLSQPPTASSCPALEGLGFFFSGIMPTAAGEDWLVLQYLNNQCYDYGLIKPATSFGEALMDYVRSCDPAAAGG